MRTSSLLPMPAVQNLSFSRQEMLKNREKQMKDTPKFQMTLKHAPILQQIRQLLQAMKQKRLEEASQQMLKDVSLTKTHQKPESEG